MTVHVFTYRCWLAGMLLCLAVAQVRAEDQVEQAPGFDVVSARSTLVGDVVRLDALFDLRLSDNLIEALQNGISLNLVIKIQILKERDYLWASTVTTLEQRYLIYYRPLTGHYVLDNLNSQVVFQFPSLEALLAVASVLSDFPLLDYSLLDPDARYLGEIHIEVDRDSFPVPLRLMSYVYGDWHLSSEWFSWP